MNSILKKWMISPLIIGSLLSCFDNKKNKVADSQYLNKEFSCMGMYEGTLPCASCPGIKTIITLYDDKSYNRSEEYLDEENSLFLDTGIYDVNCIDSVITLFDKSQKRNQSYKWTGSELRHLDIDGNEIFGSLRENYILKKNKKKCLI
jgi:uncharacterized lipoprotein NlpE involved in copper resistance